MMGNKSIAPTPNPAIHRAMESVAAATAKAEADPTRPIYHFRPPANWMNDPNGTIFADGYYQLFYQHNPYGDAWGHMHWGHARSRDLVHWEHLPIALWPSKELGEEHVFSGCAAINGAGQPMLFYTTVGPGKHDERPDNEQWAALGDEEWITWQKHPQNPILALETHGGPTFTGEWRDPYIFNEAGRTLMVVGGATAETAGVALYEAIDASLTRWRYHKLLIAKPTKEIRFYECPNFFKVPDAQGGEKWILLTSPYAPVEYMVGHFDVNTLTFAPEQEGVLDPGKNDQGSAHFYASNTLYAPEGRCILLGWVRGFPADLGWNGCLALPRLITVGADGRPRQQPVAEVELLRGAHHPLADVHVTDGRVMLEGVAGTALELAATVQLGSAQRAGLILGLASDQSGGVEVAVDGSTLTVAGCAIPFAVKTNDSITLRLFLDRSVLEVFVNDGVVAVTRVVSIDLDNALVGAFAEGGTATFSGINAWEIGSIW